MADINYNVTLILNENDFWNYVDKFECKIKKLTYWDEETEGSIWRVSSDITNQIVEIAVID